MAKLIRADWHTHTNLSDCGHPDAAPAAMMRAAKEAGLEALGITDHVILPRNRKRAGIVRELLPEEFEGMRVYVGCEADMQSATRSSIDAEYAAGVDYVVMSASHLFDPGVEDRGSLDAKGMAGFILELMNGAIDSGLADIIPHPFSVPMCPFPWPEMIANVDGDALTRTAEQAAKAGVALELNPRYPREWPDASRWLFRRILAAGCKVAISSDAHHPSQVGCRGEWYASEEEIRALGVGEENVWSIEERVSAAQRS